MAYEKRLCILKQVKKGFTADGAPVTGAVYAERMGEKLVVTPRIAGLSPLSDGRYALCIEAGGQYFCFEMKGNEALHIENAPSVAGGFAALLCFVRGEAEAIAFGHCGNAPKDYAPLLRAFSEGGKRPIPVPMPPNAVPGAPSPQVPLAPVVPVLEEDEDVPPGDVAAAEYDDEAIAGANYYAPSEEGEKDGQPSAEELPAPHPFRISRGGLTYYHEIAAKLNEAFGKYPRDETLVSAIPHSEWVKTERALLGVVYGEGVPRFLCVALKEIPPKEARAASLFVPVSPYSEKDGYYVVFQDADTGNYVKVERD